MVQTRQNKKYETAQKLLQFSVEALRLCQALLSSHCQVRREMPNSNMGVLPSMLIKEAHRNVTILMIVIIVLLVLVVMLMGD